MLINPSWYLIDFDIASSLPFLQTLSRCNVNYSVNQSYIWFDHISVTWQCVTPWVVCVGSSISWRLVCFTVILVSMTYLIFNYHMPELISFVLEWIILINDYPKLHYFHNFLSEFLNDSNFFFSWIISRFHCRPIVGCYVSHKGGGDNLAFLNISKTDI